MGGGNQAIFDDETSWSSTSTSCCGGDGGDGDDIFASPYLRGYHDIHDIICAYESSHDRVVNLPRYKDAIRSYKPGDWIERVGGAGDADYDVPETTTLLLVGPRASGKSSLVNRISRVLENDDFLPDRAQVSFNSDVPSENFKLLQKWMTQGVNHGKMIIRDSDDAVMRKNIKARAQRRVGQRRTVNFVIFVVDATSVLKSVDGHDSEYLNLLKETFNYPFLSFKDNKPAVVLTHGHELSLANRTCARAFLGDALGIPPNKQIFDIPDDNDLASQVAIIRHVKIFS
ncbi:hypothetical protein J5N97_027725 [Dioscorea zingiberensis]|uniref:Uncharacterized protein n=1 Tax=Dioscorea zingiberensis TaxID=325984 RepID=A0A9D5BXM6_9LILI|nr:hypothetical protein J5N97_027725 [Dioscorea zingiberensis]